MWHTYYKNWYFLKKYLTDYLWENRNRNTASSFIASWFWTSIISVWSLIFHLKISRIISRRRLAFVFFQKLCSNNLQTIYIFTYVSFRKYCSNNPQIIHNFTFTFFHKWCSNNPQMFYNCKYFAFTNPVAIIPKRFVTIYLFYSQNM